MHHGPSFWLVRTHTMRGYPIDAELRRTYRARRGSRRVLPIRRPLTARLVGNGGSDDSVHPRNRELAERSSNGTRG
jgi:hypothetical protein